MERLTTNKDVSEMGLIELAHNSCYMDNNHNARYRDYELDIDSRQRKSREATTVELHAVIGCWEMKL